MKTQSFISLTFFFISPDLEEFINSTILCHTNDDVDSINEIATSLLPDNSNNTLVMRSKLINV
ncbi:hypothetical protein BpHYR1_043548 [Brachionus plicatilis]|uniref:Uncharacterized protein n=1 Tax=Brachionus plicatilis TaxID=10195 RepID=A0A3M7P207_BRAPC|nr:hypothetical protein BpHYR1_043548 [Brachionus plicatilis]